LPELFAPDGFNSCNVSRSLARSAAGELFTLLGLKSRLSNDAARALAAEVVRIFDYIHNKDIIYRYDTETPRDTETEI
jgi:hypothetical protein